MQKKLYELEIRVLVDSKIEEGIEKLISSVKEVFKDREECGDRIKYWELQLKDTYDMLRK